jgi:hypothetical protein
MAELSPKEWVDAIVALIDGTKNFLLAIIVLYMGYSASLNPAIPEAFAGQWVGAAMTVVGVYFGTRIAQGRQQEPPAPPSSGATNPHLPPGRSIDDTIAFGSGNYLK